MLRRISYFTAFGALTACAPPWYLRPEHPSRIESLTASGDAVRVCVVNESQELVDARIESAAGATPAAVDRQRRDSRCAIFRGEATRHAIDSSSTVVLEERQTNGTTKSERIPLTGDGLRWQPYSSVEASTRALFLAPLSAGYSNLLEIHPSLRYRVLPALRIGAAIETRLAVRTALFGTGPSVSVLAPIAERWVASLDGEYVVGKAAYARGNWDGQWFHGPSALVALGHTQRAFSGSPSILDSGAFGPIFSAEYLFVPKHHDGIVVLGGGFYLRYGL
jgi:hypothetical protein